MPFTQYLDSKLVNLVFNDTSYTPPATLYLALSTTTPNQVQGSSTPYWGFTEPSGNAYARVAVDNNSSSFATSSTGSSDNLGTINFPTATGSWGTVAYFGFFDSASGGNLLCYGALGSPQAIATNDMLSFGPGQISLALS
jgi:hypothetical protein